MIPPFPFVAIGMAGSDSVCLPTSGKSGELSWPYQVGNNLGPKSLLVGIYHSPRHSMSVMRHLLSADAPYSENCRRLTASIFFSSEVCRYFSVVLMWLCPRSSCTVLKSTPRSRRAVA